MNIVTPIVADHAEARRDRLMSAVNRALDKNRLASKAMVLLGEWQAHNIDAARGSGFGDEDRLNTEYELAGALSDLFGCDSFEEMRSNASDELWTEHSWNASEGRALDASERSL